MSEPQTEMGRRVLDFWNLHRTGMHGATTNDAMADDICAIEAGAAEQARTGREAALREALQRIIDKMPERTVSTAMGQMFEIAVAALAADTDAREPGIDSAVQQAIDDPIDGYGAFLDRHDARLASSDPVEGE